MEELTEERLIKEMEELTNKLWIQISDLKNELEHSRQAVVFYKERFELYETLYLKSDQYVQNLLKELENA